MEFILSDIPEEIKREKYLGNFERALKLIDKWLNMNISLDLKERLKFEKERIKILLKTYPYNEEKAKDKFKELIKDSKDEEFYQLLEEGFIDYIIVNNKRYFETRFIQNIAFSLPKYQERIVKDDKREKSRNFWEKRVIEILNGESPKEYKIHIKISLKLKEKINGKKVRVWLPLPKEEFQQRAVKIISISHDKYFISPNEIPQRTIYLEGESQDEFYVEFEYRIKEWINFINPQREEKINEYIDENPPHILFSPYLKNLAKEIVNNEDSPYLKAKKIYDWITLNIRYSFVKPYILYDNIPEYTAINLKGDCGFQALLFITLCRIVGIPARWQSGWFITPFFSSPHDWALFYIAPYGWLPCDLSFGGRCKDNNKLREFCFGNLDAFRMVSNSDFMKDFIPKNKFFRIDPYDNQIGEVETEDEKIYEFETNLQVIDFKEITNFDRDIL